MIIISNLICSILFVKYTGSPISPDFKLWADGWGSDFILVVMDKKNLHITSIDSHVAR